MVESLIGNIQVHLIWKERWLGADVLSSVSKIILDVFKEKVIVASPRLIHGRFQAIDESPDEMLY